MFRIGLCDLFGVSVVGRSCAHVFEYESNNSVMQMFLLLSQAVDQTCCNNW